jgi:hypothetical protein
MLTGMTERDWLIALEVFDAVQSSRGEPGHNDRKFLEAIHYFTVHRLGAGQCIYLPGKRRRIGRWRGHSGACLHSTRRAVRHRLAIPTKRDALSQQRAERAHDGDLWLHQMLLSG